jgi:hypothetical protein
VTAWGAQALRRGFDASDMRGAPGEALKRNAQLAAGATFDGNIQYGGVADYRPGGFWQATQKIPIPSDMRADQVGRAIAAIGDNDLKALPAPPVAGDGKTPIPAERLRAGNLVANGHGSYWVALGDPADPANAKWVMAPQGGKFVLDLNALAPVLRERVPDVYRGS